MRTNVSTFFSEVYAARNALRQLVSQQLILRYRRTALGYLWTLVNPLLMMSVMALVFATLFKSDLQSFTVFLFAGMIPWNFFSAVVVQSGASFINNEGLIKKIYLPKVIFPLSVTFALLVDSALSFVVLFAIILALGGSLSWSVLFIPVAFLLLFFFAFGIGLMMSVATVFFRDLQHVILVAMQGLFFLTPILYKHEALAGEVRWLVSVNPVVPFIELFRGPLYHAALPGTATIVRAASIAFVTMVIGLVIFLQQEKKIVFRL
jgi:ABC-2 type transport system permease protein/lipopolysaccharide transport system permease protein